MVMSGVSTFSIIAVSVAAIFAVAGAVQLLGLQVVRDVYRRWDYPQSVRVVTGLLDLVAAVLLIAPATRGWGIALAAIITFGSVVVLLNHRQYLYAGAAAVLMAALVPATLAVPRTPPVQFAVKGQAPAPEHGLRLMTSEERSPATAIAVPGPQGTETRSF